MSWGKFRVLTCVTLGALSLSILSPSRASADAPTGLIISEIKINNDVGGYNEFVELFNGNASDIALSDYHLVYFNVTSPSGSDKPTTAALPSGMLAASNFFVLAQDPGQIPNSAKLPLSSLKDTGGALQVIGSDGSVSDQLAWSSSKTGLPAGAVTVPASTQSLQRPQDGNGVPQTNVGWNAVAPSPVSSVLAVSAASATDPTISNSGLAAPQITELLPNPASPKTDANDEFIELYNPNDQTFDLSGYVLQTGTTSLHNYTFPNGTSLPGGSYMAFYSAQTKADLSNNGGQARLLDPNKQTVSQSDAYGAAADGQAWAQGDNGWQWTTSPTPGAANNLTAPAGTSSSSSSATKAASTKTTAKKTTVTTTKKAKSTTTTKAKAKKSTSGSSTAGSAANVSDTLPSSSIHPWILAGIGGLALLYAAYEYREDVVNKFRQFQANRSTRRASR